MLIQSASWCNEMNGLAEFVPSLSGIKMTPNNSVFAGTMQQDTERSSIFLDKMTVIWDRCPQTWDK